MLSANTDFLRKLVKQQIKWIWTYENTKAFEKLKECITKMPCLAHYNAQSENIVILIGRNTVTETTTCRDKPIGFASIFLSDIEYKFNLRREQLAVVWVIEHFGLDIQGKPIELLTYHEAPEPIIKRNRSNKTYSARFTRK